MRAGVEVTLKHKILWLSTPIPLGGLAPQRLGVAAWSNGKALYRQSESPRFDSGRRLHQA